MFGRTANVIVNSQFYLILLNKCPFNRCVEIRLSKLAWDQQCILGYHAGPRVDLYLCEWAIRCDTSGPCPLSETARAVNRHSTLSGGWEGGPW